MLQINGDFSETNELLSSMLVNSQNKPIVMGFYQEALQESSERSLLLQRSPYMEAWNHSKLAIKEGRPDKTLIREGNLLADIRDISNYPVNGDSVYITTSVTSEKGFYYGEYHNNGNWFWAGLDDPGLNKIQDNIIDFILNGKK